MNQTPYMNLLNIARFQKIRDYAEYLHYSTTSISIHQYSDEFRKSYRKLMDGFIEGYLGKAPGKCQYTADNVRPMEEKFQLDEFERLGNSIVEYMTKLACCDEGLLNITAEVQALVAQTMFQFRLQ